MTTELPPFGALLRRYRLAAGLSQEALAERADLSVRAIGALESGERRVPYPHTVSQLARALRLAAADRARLEAAIPRRPEPATAAPDAPRPASTNLPAALTSFVGRERELAEVRRLLTTTRLLTLTGTGGCGKTRLALAVAGAVLGDYPAGVWLVDLAPLADPALVPAAAARTLGIHEQAGRALTDTVAAWLKEKRLLLVLDNCEHLLEASATLAEMLLRAAPDLAILATSRERLRAAGEVAWRVPSLAMPELVEPVAPVDLPRWAAVRLFGDRAGAVRPGFAVTAENAVAVARICRQLDGLPLAIELAAARLAVLTVEQLAVRLEDRLRLLTDGGRVALPRQQTLRATLDWSHDLLTEAERISLRWLAVFTGGWTLDAAEAVASDQSLVASTTPGGTASLATGDRQLATEDVLTVLAHLVDKSLVVVEDIGQGEARYRMLETVRQYAGERLAMAGEVAAVRARHGAWCLRLAEQADAAIRGPEQASWLARLDAERDNLRAALAWGLEHAPSVALRLVGSLWQYWRFRGSFAEGRNWLERALALDQAPTPSRAYALNGAEWLAAMQGDWEVALAWIAEGLAVSRALGLTRSIATSLRSRGFVLLMRDEYEPARQALEEAVTLSQTLDDTYGLATAISFLSRLEGRRGNYELALKLKAENIRLFEALQTPLNIARVHAHLGTLLRLRSTLDEAHQEYVTGLALARKIAEPTAIVENLVGLGLVTYWQGDMDQAAALLSDGLRLATEQGKRDTMAEALHGLGLVARRQGDPAQARVRIGESLAIRRVVGDRLGIAECLEGLAAIAGDQGQPTRAARLLGAAVALREAIGALLPPVDQPDHAATVATVRAALGEAAFARVMAAGRELSLEQAVAEALANGHD